MNPSGLYSDFGRNFPHFMLRSRCSFLDGAAVTYVQLHLGGVEFRKVARPSKLPVLCPKVSDSGARRLEERTLCIPMG